MTAPLLIITERDIRRHGKGSALGALWRQWRMERKLGKRGIHFRQTDAAAVARLYAAMSADEFEAINARQDWANWRTIPRCLSTRVADEPLRAIDLGCGSGGSTQVLAFYCPPGSHITGYEFAAPLVEVARKRSYPRRDLAPAHVDFRCQGVTEEFRDANGNLLADQIVDLVNASGVVGHHLRPETIGPLLSELKRVCRASAIVTLDVGPTLAAPQLRQLMEAAGFAWLSHHRSWCGDPYGQSVFATVHGRGA